MKRRDFLKKAGIGVAATAAVVTAKAPAIIASPKYNWKMCTTWPPHFPVLGEGADLLAKWIEELSDGRIKIQVYGGGELIPPLGVFDAVKSGQVEMGHGAAYYWAGKHPATQFFAAVPFGMNPQQLNAWFYGGDGIKLWEELYAQFNLVPFPTGNTGVQMAGWFRKEIKSINDLKGLKMRIPGLGGKVLAKAGGSAVLLAGGEIYTGLDRGVIDATEWVGPYHDYLMGFQKITKNYYYPGWHEPGTCLESFVNKQKFDALPKDLQGIIRTAAMKSNIWMLSEFEAKNQTYLEKLTKESGVKLLRLPDDVLKTLHKLSIETLDEIAAADPFSKKVLDNYRAFHKNIQKWYKTTEDALYYSESLQF